MSLVNDMLRDLDARRASDESDLGSIEPSPAPSRGWQTLAICLTAIILMATSALGYRWLMADKRPTESPLQPSIAGVDTVVETTATDGRDTEPVAPIQQSTDTAPMTEVPEASATIDAVQPLLVAAEQALTDNRLTQPPVNNAHALYRHALLLEPNNQEALIGITRVQARYDELVREAIAQNDWVAAERYLARAETVDMPAERLASLSAVLEKARAETSRVKTTEMAAAVPEVQTAQPPVTNAGDDVANSITLSWRSQEAAAVTQANGLRRQGRTVEAITILKPIVESEPRAESAALLLFDIYLEAGDLASAREQSAQTKNAHLQHYYQAKLLMADGQGDAALAVLQLGDPRGAVRQPYLALQAALHQRAGQYPQALRLYQHLVELDNREPSYWLGMGVAAEASGQPTQALRAFVAADQLGSASSAVSSYIKQRIEALSP